MPITAGSADLAVAEGLPGPLRQLALSVARCPEVDAARLDPGHPCHGVVCLQSPDPSQWQVPEAWAGNLTDGQIVFVSSNPSISEAGDAQSGDTAEAYPTGSWDDEKIADFVINRFAHGWATAAGKFLRTDGTYSPKAVTFWTGTRNRASELLGRTADPAADFVMSEVVHCKSKKEKGVAKAASICAALHLDRILAATSAPLVVILGAAARDLLVPEWDLPAGFGAKGVVGIDEGASLAVRTLGGRPRLVAFLWHPSGMTGPKTFAGAYPEHFAQLQRLVAGDAEVESFESDPAEPPPGDVDAPAPPATKLVPSPRSVPRPRVSDTEFAVDVLGDPHAWVQYVPAAWRACAEPRLAGPSPAELFEAGGPRVDYMDHMRGNLAALLHLLMYGMGWTRPDLGLDRWLALGGPTEHPVMKVVDHWWEEDLPNLLAFAAETGTLRWIGQRFARTVGFTKFDMSDVPDRFSNRRTEPEWVSVWDGGWDPLHLSDHVTSPARAVLDAPVRPIEAAPALPGRDLAVLLQDAYPGWYSALAATPRSASAPGPVVDVVVRPIGWLGQYRCSDVTGLWFRGDHESHLLGN